MEIRNKTIHLSGLKKYAIKQYTFGTGKKYVIQESTLGDELNIHYITGGRRGGGRNLNGMDPGPEPVSQTTFQQSF